MRDEKDQRGLHCWRCGGHKFRVVYVRRRPGGIVVRRRACRRCTLRVTT
jgi:transcriptional regulator NrdR family protein